MLHISSRCATRSVPYGLGLLGPRTAVRHSSTSYFLRTPPPSAPREVPTPLVFVSSSTWDSHSCIGLRPLATMLAARGFTCLEVDLASPEEPATSEALMQRFEEALTSHIRLTMIPFAPVIFARGPGALIAQTYISSHPASGLLLISPPVSNAHLRSTSEAKGQNLLPTHLPEFNFEPQFPCAILCTQQEAAALAGHRMWKDDHVDKLVTRDGKAIDGQEGLVKIEQWLDEVGV